MTTPPQKETEDETPDDTVLKLVVKKLASQALLFGVAGLVILLSAWKVSNGSLPLVLAMLFVFVVALGGYLFVELKNRSKTRHRETTNRSLAGISESIGQTSNALTVDLWTSPVPRDGARDITIASKNKKTDYRTGQRIVVGFRASQSCYLTLLNIGTSGKLTVLFPNALHSENFIEGGRDYRIPESDAEFVYELQGPIGVEKLKAVATLKKIALLDSSFAPDGSLFRTVDPAVGARDIGVIQKKVSCVPKAEWAEDTCEFTVT